MDLATLLRQARDSGRISTIAGNRRRQFGTQRRPNVLATVLPERMVRENGYREAQVRYRTMVANDGTRYSPPQRKRSAITGWMDVILHDQDIADSFTSADYDGLIAMLGEGRDMEAMAAFTGWLDNAVAQPLAIKSELQRWQALVNAKVIRTGDDNLYEEIAYSNPAGHRVAAGGSFADPAVDPILMIQERVTFLANKGYTVRRIFAGTPVINGIITNEKVMTRGARVTFTESGAQVGISGLVDLAGVNTMLGRDGIPPIERHDQQYNTSTGSKFFLDRATMLFVCTTGRTESLDLGDGTIEPIEDVLGYTAIGRAAGQSNAGRVIWTDSFEDKPPRIDAQGWQTSAPVILEPEAVATLHTIPLV
jgi:hypothetical protein